MLLSFCLKVYAFGFQLLDGCYAKGILYLRLAPATGIICFKVKRWHQSNAKRTIHALYQLWELTRIVSSVSHGCIKLNLVSLHRWKTYQFRHGKSEREEQEMFTENESELFVVLQTLVVNCRICQTYSTKP
ncbi:hypothetical protein SCA6_000110 [Theobroma cacao]